MHFLTGTDEHGQKVEKSAEAAGMAPQAFTDKVSQNFRDLAEAMNFSNDDFIRTTEERHIKSCQELWKRLKERGEIYLGSYAGWYAVRDEAYLRRGRADHRARRQEARAVRRRGRVGGGAELFLPAVGLAATSCWSSTRRIPTFIAPDSRRNEVISFVKSGLRDLSISRTTFNWGMPVPDDPAHVMYVWLDALTNYITAVGYPDESAPSYKKFWPADLHMVGKDIVRFHTVYWPAFLMAAGLQPPQRVFAHGWWTNEGQKMSKSLGNVDRAARHGRELRPRPVRYFLLREMPFGNDGDFSHRAMVQPDERRSGQRPRQPGAARAAR